ncbi:hypothetical protein KC345_g9046 [Hortaea werneckii]|nr:hypothetical protein KC345_g9046 [Hortaea werneckii]
MPLEALRSVARAQNGVGAFILQCKRLDFHYCDWAGSSKGMNTFLTSTLPAFARKNPGIEISVSPRPGRHPIIRGSYINGKQRAICVRNMQPSEILEKTELLKGASGEKLKRTRKPVTSMNESVRGVWDPFHRHSYKVTFEHKGGVMVAEISELIPKNKASHTLTFWPLTIAWHGSKFSGQRSHGKPKDPVNRDALTFYRSFILTW